MSNGTPITISAGLAPSTPGFAGANSFAAAKQLQIAIRLAAGGSALQPTAFADTGASVLTIANERASAHVIFAGGVMGSYAEVAVWGLSQSRMNELQTLGVERNKAARNILSVFAGDAVAGLSRVFTGNIVQAFGDYSAAPDVAMRFLCKPGYVEGTQPFASTSFNGSVPVTQVFSSIATAAGWGFQNNGVDASISVSNPYYSGAAPDQFRKLASDVRVNAMLLPGNQTAQNYVLTIWPRGGLQATGAVPIVSPTSGMIGYPTFQQNGNVIVRALYNPAFAMGNQIQIQSSIFTNQSLATLNATPNSLWGILRIDHLLDTMVPKGQWMTTIEAAVNTAFKPTLPAPP